MESKTKKILVITGSVLAGLSLTSYLLFRKFKKLLEYNLKVKRLKIVKFSLTNLDLRIFLAFKNPSKLTIVVAKQEYEVFLNGIYITKLTSNQEQVIEPNATSILNVNLQADPKLIFQKLAHMQKPLELITNFRSQKLKLVTELWTRLGFFKIPMTIPYESAISSFGQQ